VIDEKRALQMYELAMALVQAKGVLVTIGLMTLRECRHGMLIIRYQPNQDWLDVWSARKVLTVKRWNGSLRIVRYVPGHWEHELEAAAAKSPPKR
jgi:hypothetical protein